MLIKRKGIYREVTEKKFKDLYKGQGYEKVEMPKSKPKEEESRIIH